MLRQLYFGAMDIELHSPNYDPFGDKTIFDLQHEMADKYAVIPPLADDRFLCSFGHIFAGGYSAGYYSYKWAGTLLVTLDYFQCFDVKILFRISFSTVMMFCAKTILCATTRTNS